METLKQNLSHFTWRSTLKIPGVYFTTTHVTEIQSNIKKKEIPLEKTP